MSEPVELGVRSQLRKIIDELDQIAQASGKVGEGLNKTSKEVGDNLNKQVKKTENFITALRGLVGRAATQMSGDFRSLFSFGALSESLKLGKQFEGTVKSSLSLQDTIRKLGPILGITENKFVSFQSRLSRGLGEIGLSADVASNALSGLSETSVRGEDNSLAYAKAAGQLGSLTGQQGQEGAIAKGLAQTVVARGGNANDLGALKNVSDDVLRIRNATGKSATEALGALNELFAHTNKQFRSQVSGGGGVSLASASLLGGKDATSFLERYLGMDKFSRAGLEAQGFGKILGKNGEINYGAVQGTLGEAQRRGMGDAQAGLKTFGFSDDEAKGFIRLAEAMQQNRSAIEGARTQVVDLNEAYRKGKSLGEAFKSSLNRIVGVGGGAVGGIGKGLTDVLGKASESNLGAAGVVLGGGALAAVLSGFGLRGIGRGLGIGGLAKATASESLTGRSVQDVRVINFSDMPGGGVGGALKGALGTGALATGGLLTAGLSAGAALTLGIPELAQKMMGQGKGGPGDPDFIEAFMKSMKLLLDGQTIRSNQPQKHIVELNKRDLKASKQPSRGASYGP
jgi:hypothetical protein